MKSVIELELELSQAKLAKMTSTVKQLGTKLKDANLKLEESQMSNAKISAANRHLENMKAEMSAYVLTPKEKAQRIQDYSDSMALVKKKLGL